MTCQVWGVLNVTPDSFSDGGQFVDVDSAVSHGLEMIAQGADVIDVGGESTRPGAERISIDTEYARTIPVVERLVAAGARVSIDTMRPEIALAAVKAGAVIVNDVSGGKADSLMFNTVANLECDYVLMHWRGHSTGMDALNQYVNVTQDVLTELEIQHKNAVEVGVDPARIIWDAGFGFAKDIEQNWELLRNLPQLLAGSQRHLVGVSRKRMLAPVVSPALQAANNPMDRDIPTAAISFYAAQLGAYAVRVHDVAGSVSAIRVASALER